jgi:N-acetylmuramoyl-L-alanine amidase
MRRITHHIIHCSDSAHGDVATIRDWHKQRGFTDVGYHFIIRPDGEVEIGRHLPEIGAHCAGHNATSIGTCLIGKKTFTEPQFAALRRLHSSLRQLFPNLVAAPHNAFNASKTCPNFDIKAVLGETTP